MRWNSKYVCFSARDEPGADEESYDSIEIYTGATFYLNPLNATVLSNQYRRISRHLGMWCGQERVRRWRVEDQDWE